MIVDEIYVARYLQQVVAYPPGLEFRPVDDDDPSMDTAVEIWRDGVDTDFNVQVGGGYLILNECTYQGEGEQRRLYSSTHHSEYGVQPGDLLELAKDVQRHLTEKAHA